MIWASCWFNDVELGGLPVINPGACGGRTWFVEYTGDVPIRLVVEAETAYDALIVLSNDPEWGETITLCPVDDDDPAIYGGKFFVMQDVRVHGDPSSLPPYPVRYHGDGYPQQGIHPRQYALARLN